MGEIGGIRFSRRDEGGGRNNSRDDKPESGFSQCGDTLPERFLIMNFTSRVMEEIPFSMDSLKHLFTQVFRTVLLSLPFLGEIALAPSADRCADLIKTLRLDSSLQIILTEAYPNNSTFQDPYSLAYPTPALFLPEFCRVYCNITTSPYSASLFEVWLPIKTWNSRFMMVGNSGATGGINYPALGVGVRAGYATASTNCGHNSSSFAGDWQADNKEVIIDFGWFSFLDSFSLLGEPYI